MKSNLPEKIKIAGTDWTIESKPMDSMEKYHGTFGLTYSMQSKIIIVITGNNHADVDTLLHEIFHAIFFTYGIQEDDDEERTVAALGTAWVQVLRDNPELRKYIERCVK